MVQIHRQPVLSGVACLVAFGLYAGGESTVSLLAQQSGNSRAALLARASEVELDTDYVPPPGDPLSHHILVLRKPFVRQYS